MYLLDKPRLSVENFYKDILYNRHNNEKNQFLITRLLLIEQQLIEEEKKYNVLASTQELYSITEQRTISIDNSIELNENFPRQISSKEMQKVYNDYLVDKPGSSKIGRKVYNSIFSNTYYSLCPYCSHREVKTLDHYLPKSKFILHVVNPLNLLPSCSDCNKEKLNDLTLSKDKMLIHPYFDDVSNVDWLACEVEESTWPVTFTYKVSENITNTNLKSRIDYQFKLLNLNKLYADNATREFYKRVKLLIKEFNSNPSNKAMDFINDNYESYRYENTNSWQTKMFEALGNSEWFIEEALPNLESYYLFSE